MKRKGILGIVLSAAMVVGMTGCGVYESSDSSSASSAASSASAGTEESVKASSTGTVASASGETTSDGEKVFRYSVNTEPTTLDPDKANSIGDNEIQHAIQEGLVRNTGGEITPGIAESWDVSDDGLTYTFHLRDAQWSDGQPVKAQDFVYGLQRLMDPDTASEYAFIGEVIKNGAAVESGDMKPEELGVEAPDDKTVVITLENPTSYFLSLIGASAQFVPVRQDIVEEYGTDYAATADKNVYCGPFVLSSTDNMTYVFEKNPTYWDVDSIKLDRCELSVVTDDNTALALYESGDLDYVKIPTDQVTNYEGQDQSYMNGNEDYLYINEQSDNPLLSDQNFRLALNYGLDRNSYIQLATNNVYTATNTLVMPLVSGVEKTYGEEYTLDSYPLDGDKDKALDYLQKAMDDQGIANASDITITLTTTDQESSKKIAEVVQELWQDTLGINVEVKQVTYANIYGEVLPNGDYEIAYAGWGPDYSDPYTYLDLFRGDNPYNYSKYQNDKVDELLKASQTETDAKTRMDELNQAEQLILDDGAFVPLQLRQQHYLLNSKVTGVVFYFCSVNIDWVYADISA